MDARKFRFLQASRRAAHGFRIIRVDEMSDLRLGYEDGQRFCSHAWPASKQSQRALTLEQISVYYKEKLCICAGPGDSEMSLPSGKFPVKSKRLYPKAGLSIAENRPPEGENRF